MLHKTRGIVLKTFNYSETSLIVHVLTEKFGTQSYLLKGVRKNKTKIKMSMLQPLHLLDMVVYHKPNGGLQSIAELKNDPILSEIPYNIIKTSLNKIKFIERRPRNVSMNLKKLKKKINFKLTNIDPIIKKLTKQYASKIN